VSRLFTKLDVTNRVQISIAVHDADQSWPAPPAEINDEAIQDAAIWAPCRQLCSAANPTWVQEEGRDELLRRCLFPRPTRGGLVTSGPAGYPLLPTKPATHWWKVTPLTIATATIAAATKSKVMQNGGPPPRTEPALSYSPPRVLVREHRQPAHTAAKSRPSSVPMTIRRHESARSGVIHTNPAVQANARTSLLDAHRW